MNQSQAKLLFFKKKTALMLKKRNFNISINNSVKNKKVIITI